MSHLIDPAYADSTGDVTCGVTTEVRKERKKKKECYLHLLESKITGPYPICDACELRVSVGGGNLKCFGAYSS